MRSVNNVRQSCSLGGNIHRWLFYIIMEACFASVFITFTGGAFLIGLALANDATDFEIGVLAAIPFAAQTAQLISAYLIDRFGKRKSITSWGLFLGRQTWWIIALIILLPIEKKLEAIIIVVVISNILTMIAAPGWLSWVSEIIPEKIRGRYFGNRNSVVAITTVTTTIIGGILLDYSRNTGKEQLGFAIIVIIACISAILASIFLYLIPDSSPKDIKTGLGWFHFIEPFKHKGFRRLLKVFFFWNIAIGMSAVFFIPHMLNFLKMNFTQISLYISATALIAITLNKPWGAIIDRFGCRPVIIFCGFGIAIIPLIWLIPRPGFLWILIIEMVYSGALWAGFNLAAFNIPISVSPKTGRTVYLAVFAVITGSGFFAASLLGGCTAQTLGGFKMQVGSQNFINYHVLFAISALLRLLAAITFLTLSEPKEKGLPVMITFMGYSVLKWLSVGRQIHPWFRNFPSI